MSGLDDITDMIKHAAFRQASAQHKIKKSHCVLGIEYDNGVLFMSSNPDAPWQPTIWEVYDQIIMAASGERQDYELLRKAAVRQALLNGYKHSRRDVMARDIVDDLIAPYISYAHSSARTRGLEMQALFAELLDDRTIFYKVNYDGKTRIHGCYSAIGAQGDKAELYLHENIEPEGLRTLPLEAVLTIAMTAIQHGLDDAQHVKLMKDFIDGKLEAGVLDRTDPSDRKYRRLIVSPTGEYVPPTLYAPQPKKLILPKAIEAAKKIEQKLLPEKTQKTTEEKGTRKIDEKQADKEERQEQKREDARTEEEKAKEAEDILRLFTD